MCKVMAVVSPDLAPGFELAGIEAARARNAREASVALQSAVENGEYGIVVIDETFLNDFDEATKVFCAASMKPLIVALPGGMKWPREEERGPDEYAMSLIRRAIGHQVKIQL